MSFFSTFIPKEFKLELDDQKHKPLSFGNYILLETLKSKIDQTIKKKDINGFTDAIKQIINLYTTKSINEIDPPKVFLSVFQILHNNPINDDLVFLKPPPKDPRGNPEDNKPPRYNFDGRFFAQWILLLAKKLGWSEKQILDLDTNRAFYYIQEMLVDDHMDREWKYRLSELAYKYDQQTKKSKYVPLPKPYWMDDNIDGTIKKTKIPLKMLPYGVTNISGMETASRDEMEKKQQNRRS